MIGVVQAFDRAPIMRLDSDETGHQAFSTSDGRSDPARLVKGSHSQRCIV
jgi:hypothetical protein